MSTETEEITNKIIVAIEGDDEFFNYEDYDLTFESSDEDVLNAISGAVSEKFNVSLREADGTWLYKTRRANTNKNIYIIPNSTAG